MNSYIIHVLLNILKTCSNTQITNNIIETFAYLNSENFHVVFNTQIQKQKTTARKVYAGKQVAIIKKEP